MKIHKYKDALCEAESHM